MESARNTKTHDANKHKQTNNINNNKHKQHAQHNNKQVGGLPDEFVADFYPLEMFYSAPPGAAAHFYSAPLETFYGTSPPGSALEMFYEEEFYLDSFYGCVEEGLGFRG